MTFTIRIRRGGGMTVQRYSCPDHGDFDATVPRDKAGNPPNVEHCPDPDCRRPSPWRISGPPGRVRMVEVLRGKSDERPPPSVMLDTRPLAEGMSRTEWDKQQSRINRDITWKRGKDIIS